MQVKKVEIRELILRHALDEFEKNSYANATIRHIAERSKISIGNIYRYFENKDELFQAIIQPVYSKLSALIFDLYRKDAMEPIANISTIASQVSKGIMEVYGQYGRELMILVDKNTGSRYENFMQTLIRMVNERLKQEMPLGDDPTQVLSYIVSSGFVEGLFTVLRKYENSKMAQDIIQRMILFYFDDIQFRLDDKR